MGFVKDLSRQAAFYSDEAPADPVLTAATQVSINDTEGNFVGGLVEDALAENAERLDGHSQQLAEIANKQWNDFLTASVHPWGGNPINSGTWTGLNPTSKHNGIRTYTSSTTANSGYGILANVNSFMLIGGEKTTFIFKTPTVQSTITRRIGFLNSIDSTPPTDAASFRIIGASLYGSCNNNSNSTATSTGYILAADTWYRGVITINSDATLATFTLYADDSASVLWSDTITTNIPVNRLIGHGDIATSSGTTAITLGHLDYMDMIIPNARRVL